MTKEIVLLDLFSGMGGFAKGFKDGGFIIKKHFFSEIEPNAIANYKYNFKNSIYAGPIQSIDRAALGKVDVITFGSPCQDFSIAGKGAGLDGARSSLILEAIKIITEKKPSFFIWENVKGAFSSNAGSDFWAIIQAFTNIGGYNIEWQLLNTLWVLPPNRERIYLVGHLATAERNFKPLFPFTKNDKLFINQETAKKRQSQTEHSTTISGECYRADNTFIKNIGTLTGGGNSGGLHSDMAMIKAHYYSRSQQDRLYDTSGVIGCLSKSRLEDKVKTSTTQPRNGNPKKGGTGLLAKENSSYCLDTHNGQAIELNQNQYRRLTEIECERLQGFPDNWTKFGVYSKKVWINKKQKTFEVISEVREIKKTNRYKLIGNAVTANFPKMIAKKIIQNYT